MYLPIDNANYQSNFYAFCGTTLDGANHDPMTAELLRVSPDAPTDPNEAYQAAMSFLLSRACLVGISERFSESIFLLSAKFGSRYGWRELESMQSDRSPLDDVKLKVIRRIEKITTADRQLYDERRTRLEDMAEACQFGTELARYRDDLAVTDAQVISQVLLMTLEELKKQNLNLQNRIEAKDRLLESLEIKQHVG